MSEELSPAQQKLASELRNLAVDPDYATRRSIMRAVMEATLPVTETRWQWRPWRLLIAVAGTVALLAAGTLGAFAASSNAPPRSPAYQLRLAGEGIRLALATPMDREQLRIDFARDRFRQAQQIANRDPTDAQVLLQDGRRYLRQANDDLNALPPGERQPVQDHLNQVQEDADRAQGQVEQPTPTPPEPTPTPPEPTPTPPEPTPTPPEPTPTLPEPTPTPPEPTPTPPEPSPTAQPEPTPATPDPSPTAQS